jgi:hypothetical protein
MEHDFHYDLIYSIAKMTCFPNADIIAYSSQYVDDNNRKQYFRDGKEALFPRKIRTNGGSFHPIMTQTISTKALDPMVQRCVYVPFHFLPGDNTLEIDGKTNAFSTTPNSENARTLIRKALDSGNPYLIGIALHTFADTWSHQNFTGFDEEWNSVFREKSIFRRLPPNIGHAEVTHTPDVISAIWIDHRINEKIENWIRALKATGEIYKTLRKISGKGPNWTDIKSDYRQIMKASDKRERIEKINDLLKENKLDSVPNYSEDKWLDAALNRSHSPIEAKRGFYDSEWYHFQQAAKIHFATVMNLIKEL